MYALGFIEIGLSALYGFSVRPLFQYYAAVLRSVCDTVAKLLVYIGSLVITQDGICDKEMQCRIRMAKHLMAYGEGADDTIYQHVNKTTTVVMLHLVNTTTRLCMLELSESQP